MKKILLASVFLLTLSIMTCLPHEAHAVPAFARQTGMACTTCHFQHYPALNAFGRSFKASGFTMVGGQSMVEGDFLSIPASLNASLMAKAVYQQTYNDNKVGMASQYDHGTWSFPTDASLLIAGRAGTHVGFFSEISLVSGAGTNDPSTNTVTTEPRMVSLKIPFVFGAGDTQFNIIPFTTDGAGPSWNFEGLNTGMVETHTPVLHKSETSAPQYIGVGTAATGLSFVAYRPFGYLDYAVWSNDHTGYTGSQQHVSTPLHYFRAALTPTVAGWDFGIGAATWQGTEKRGALDVPVKDHANAWATDTQAMGTIMNHPVGFFASYARAKKSKNSTPEGMNIFNSSANKDKSAWAVLGSVGVIPNRLEAMAGYRSGKNGDPNGDGKVTDNATTLALTYSLALNIQISLDHSWYSGSGKGDESAASYTTGGQPGSPPTPVAGPSALTTLTVWTVF